MRQVFNRTYSNRELMDGITNGDSDCAVEFHCRYGKRISQLVWSLLGADRDHEDVVQMVFVSVLDSVSTVKDPTRLDVWIDSVTFRTVRKELRSRKYRRLVVPASDTFPEVTDPKHPESALIAKRFYMAMEKLKPEDHMMFILKYFENYSLLEMSDISGWSIATVKRRINSAVDAFKKVAREDVVLTSCIGANNNVG